MITKIAGELKCLWLLKKSNIQSIASSYIPLMVDPAK